jgi:hypothetical protein
MERCVLNIMERISPDIARSIRESMDITPDDTSKDVFLSSLSDRELFERYCEANGIIGWSERLIGVLDSIRAAQTSVTAERFSALKNAENNASAVA